MKSSRIKHVLITSIIFLIIIVVIVMVYQKKLDAIPKEAKAVEQRVIVKADIKPGDKLVFGALGNVELKEVAPVLSVENLVKDITTADGKIAVEPIYKGEMVTTNRIINENDLYKNGERLYSIKMDADSTGGYNIGVGEYVDICLLYSTKEGNSGGSNSVNNAYQNLPANKLIDIVLAKRKVMDIKDEAGVSIRDNSAVKPGYVYFKLTYDEINKFEIAKKQGNIFIGKAKNYVGDPHEETFMKGAKLPEITPKVVAQ